MINNGRDASPRISRAVFPEAPSLRIWKMSVVVATLLIVGLFLLYAGQEADRNARFQRKHLDMIRLCRSNPRFENHDHVVMLGTSLLGHCVRASNPVESARKMGLGNLRFLSLYRPKGNIHHFLPIMGDILRISPKLLLIQSDLLFYHEYASPYSLDFLLSLPRYITSIIRADERVQMRNWRLKHSPMKVLSHKIRAMQNRMARPTADPRVVRDIIDHFRVRGIQVVIFDIPRSGQLEAAMKRLREENHGDFMDFLKGECRVPWISFPRGFSHSLFVDYAHFTPAGGRKFIDWLVAEIHRLLREKVLP